MNNKNDSFLKISEIDLKNILYDETQKINSKNIIYLKYKKKDCLRNLTIQLPLLLNKNKPKKKNNFYELNIPLSKNDKNNLLIINLFNDFDKKLIYDASLNSSTWFENVSNSNDICSINYKKILSNFDNEYFNLKVKIINTNQFKTQIYNFGERITFDEIPINYYFRMVIEFHSILVNGSKFRLFLKPSVISFIKPQFNFVNFNFLEDSEDDESLLQIINSNNENIKENKDRDIEKNLIVDESLDYLSKSF